MRSHSAQISSRTRAAASLLMLVALATPVFAGPAQELFRTSAEETAPAIDHGAWDSLLKTYVKADPDGLNRVDYAAFKRDGHKQLKGYIAALEQADPKALSRAEQFALIANLYNAKTIDIVLDAYPVKSIKDISLGGGLLAAFTGGPWTAKVVTLKGVRLSLDDLEHQILRPLFKDPRAHYAVNCASIGCPNLRAEAFTGTRLDAELDAAASAYVNHSRAVSVRDGKATVSSIYKWFQEDFGGANAGVLAHLRRYAAPALKAELANVSEIAGDAYDWGLNDVAR